MPGHRVLRRIAAAAEDRRLVRVTRGRGWDRLDGSIVARSAKWLLLATVVDAGFHGHTLVRVSDVRRVDERASEGFVERALAAEGSWPLPALDGVDVSSTRAALRSLQASGSLVSVFYEAEDPDVCQIGVPAAFGRRRFRLQAVSPSATWDTDDAVFRYREVSRMDVGAAYERRLLAVAGPPPARSVVQPVPGPAPVVTVARTGPAALTPDVLEQAAPLLQDLVRKGAALGWVEPPSTTEVADLLSEVAADVEKGDAALVTAWSGGELAGLGYWRRFARPTHRPHADLEKLAVGPRQQGRGVGRLLVAELVAAAVDARVEVLTLDLRGDNVRAERLYASLGFVRYGVLERFVAVREARYDKVFMALDLRA